MQVVKSRCRLLQKRVRVQPLSAANTWRRIKLLAIAPGTWARERTAGHIAVGHAAAPSSASTTAFGDSYSPEGLPVAMLSSASSLSCRVSSGSDGSRANGIGKDDG